MDVGTIVPSSRLASSSAIDLTTGSGSTATKSLDAVHGDREKPGAERIAILGLGPGDYRGACLLRQVETMF